MPSYNDSTELCAVGKLDNTCLAFSAALRNFATDLLFSPQLHFHCLQTDFKVKYCFLNVKALSTRTVKVSIFFRGILTLCVRSTIGMQQTHF